MAIGEAVLSPAAISLIADLFPPEKRALPTAVYAATESAMHAGSYVAGAGGLMAATSLSGDVSLAPWRLTLIILAAPGLILALVTLLAAREPARRALAVDETGDHPGVKEFARYLLGNVRFYLPFYLYIGAFSAAQIGAIVWMPTVFVRNYGVSTVDAGYFYGLAALPGGAIGVFVWAMLSARLEARGKTDASVYLLMIGAMTALPFAATAPLVADGTARLVCVALGAFGFSSMGPLISLAIQQIGPNRMRARLIAMNVLISAAVGVSAGPLLVPGIAQLFAEPEQSLPASVALTCAISLIAGMLALIRALPAFRDSVEATRTRR